MKKRALVTGLVCIGLGYGWGVHTTSQPPVQTKLNVVKVPEVITHVEEKVVTKSAPMLDSCTGAISLLNQSIPLVSDTTEAAGKIGLSLSDAAIRVAFNESAKMKLLIDEINKERGNLSDAAVILSTNNSQLQKLAKQCEIDRKK